MRPPFLDQLSTDERATALARMEELRVAAGELLIHRGQAGEAIACVLSGALDVQSAAGVPVGTATEGEIVGETALFRDRSRQATVVARTDVHLLLVTTDQYEALRAEGHPAARNLERAVLRQQMARMRAVGDRITAQAGRLPSDGPGPSFFAQVRALFGVGGPLALARVDRVAALKRLALVEEADDAVLDDLGRRFGARSVPEGAMLCTEGERGRRVFVLVDGEVDVLKALPDGSVRLLATLAQGAVFGVVAATDDRPRMASVVAARRSTVLVLDDADWDRLVDEPSMVGSVFRRAMIRCLADQLTYANAQLARFVAGEGDALGRAGVGVEAWLGS